MWFLLIIQCTFVLLCSASNQRRTYRTIKSFSDRYDRSVTTFDPSGRLLQVEYAQAAVVRKPLLLVMAVVNNVCYIVASSSNIESHSRTSPKAPLIHRISQHIFLVGLGLVGDIRAVASHLRLQAQQHLYNCDEEWTVQQAAEALSSLHHQLTHQSGVRPLGIAGFLLGTDAIKPDQSSTIISNATQMPTARLFHCSPGGLPEDCLYYCTGANKDTILPILQEQYPRFYNCTEEEIVQTLVETIHSLTDNNPDASKDDPGFDVWIIRSVRSTRPEVSCFQNLKNSACSFAKLHTYYNRSSTDEKLL